MVEKRREFLSEGKMTEYKEVNANLTTVEENCFNELLQELYDNLGINEEIF